MDSGIDQRREGSLTKEQTLQQPELRYYASSSGLSLRGFYELWQYRQLVWMLAVRDIKVRYRQTAVGVAWAVLQPALLMVIFSVFFQLLGKKPTESNVPYVVSFLCGYLPWQLLASTLNEATQSLVAHRSLISKVYFPRTVLPVSAIIGGLLDFVVASGLLLVLMLWFGISPTPRILLLPVFVVLTLMISIGAGLWLSALNALYRDIGYLVPFILQVGFFISPVVYETDQIIPARFQGIYALNPMVAILDGFRWCVLGHAPPSVTTVVVSFVTLLALFLGGMIYFRRVERQIVDRI